MLAESYDQRQPGYAASETEADARLDDVDRHIIDALRADARLPMNKLAVRVGLSAPSVAARVRRLEVGGVIRGYHAAVDHAKLGRPVVAFVSLTVAAHGPACEALIARLSDDPRVLEVHRVTGGAHLLLKAALASVADLDGLVRQLSHHGAVTSDLVLSSPTARADCEQHPRLGTGPVPGSGAMARVS